MALKDLVVVMGGSARDDANLALAIKLAERDDAHLDGFCPLNLLFPITPIFTASGYGGVLASQELGARLEADAWTKADDIEAQFHRARLAHGLNGSFHVAAGVIGDALANRARTTDLLVLGQSDPDHKPPPAGRHVIEDVLIRAGRPLLLVPYAGAFETVATNVLIGWNGTREAARAAHDALALIAPDAAVTILTVEHPDAKYPPSETIPAADMAQHLARHGLKVAAARTVTDGGISDADALLSYAADCAADLLVIGGYGHSPTREMLLGGVTRAVLQHMTLPVLMSH